MNCSIGFNTKLVPELLDVGEASVFHTQKNAAFAKVCICSQQIFAIRHGDKMNSLLGCSMLPRTFKGFEKIKSASAKVNKVIQSHTKTIDSCRGCCGVYQGRQEQLDLRQSKSLATVILDASRWQ